LCYLCCRTAEKLVNGELADLGTVDTMNQESAEYFHLHAFLELPALNRTAEFIRSPEVTSSINRMAKSLQVTA
jgi:hypothetical protein